MDQKETKKTIRTFGIASFLNDMGSDMIYPIWPLFVTSVLGANMTVLGLIDGLGDAIVSISKAVSGYISDRIRKRKIFIWTGYLFGSVSRLGYAFSTLWQQLIPFRILDRAGKIRSAPRDAIVADISEKEKRGGHFGFLKAMDNMGAVVGILVCIIFFKYLGYRNLFLIAAIPSIIGALLVITAIKEKKPQNDELYKGISFKDVSGDFRLFLFLSAIFALGSFSYSFLLVFAKQFGFKLAFVPVLYLIFTAIASVFSIPFGKLVDKMGGKTVLLISFVLWGLTCLSFILSQSYIAIIFSFILYGMHKGALEPSQKTFVSALAPSAYRASSLGGFQMVIGLSALPSSLVAGILWDKINIFTPFYLSVGLTALSSLLLLFVKEK